MVMPIPLVVMFVPMLVNMIPIVRLLLPENFAGQIFFAIRIYIDFGRRNSAAQHPRNLQARAYIHSRDCIFEELRRHSGIQQRAQEHVAADAGKTVKVGYAHKSQKLNQGDTRSSQEIHEDLPLCMSVSSVVRFFAGAAC
jgi:hypothetical protein